MKKFFNISLLTLVSIASLSLMSCKNETDPIFDDDAVIRMKNAMADYTDLLVSNGGKWQLQYFSNSDEPGYVYILTFEKDGSVTISGHNNWINIIQNGGNYTDASAFGSEKSMWQVIGDNGLVLSFNTYNRYFHLFADPYNIPDKGGASGQGTVNEAGYGHEGDYEFNIMGRSENSDTIFLTGKKYDHPMRLIRMSSSLDDETFLSEVASLNKSMYSSKLPYVFIVLPDGVRWYVENASSGNMRMYREGSDRITSSEYHNFIITHDGMSFMHPIVLDGYTIQNFVRQADGTVLCTDDNKTIITAESLPECLANKLLEKWQSNPKTQMGGIYYDLMTSIGNELKNAKLGTLKNMEIRYNSEKGCYDFRMYATKAGKSPDITYYFNFNAISDTQVKFVFNGERNANANSYDPKCPSFKAFVEAVGAATFNLSAESLLAPINITMAESNNSENYIIWSIP